MDGDTLQRAPVWERRGQRGSRHRGRVITSPDPDMARTHTVRSRSCRFGGPAA
jgi:hypothetical protein